MYNKIVFAVALLISFGVSMLIFSLGTQPEKVADNSLTFELRSGSQIVTQGRGIASFSSCSFFEVTNAAGTPTYGVNQSESENCGDTQATAATMTLEKDDVVTVMTGRRIKVNMEASDDFIVAAVYPDSVLRVLLIFSSLIVGFLCLVCCVGVFVKK